MVSFDSNDNIIKEIKVMDDSYPLYEARNFDIIFINIFQRPVSEA